MKEDQEIHKTMERLDSINKIRMPRSHEINYRNRRFSYEPSRNELEGYISTCRSNSIIYIKDKDSLRNFDISIGTKDDDILQCLDWNELYAQEREFQIKSKNIFNRDKKDEISLSPENLGMNSFNKVENTREYDSLDTGRSQKMIPSSNNKSNVPSSEIKYKEKNIENNVPINIGVDLACNYDIQNCIGSGKFGRVYKIRNQFSGKIVAAKEIPYQSKNAKDSISDEIEILKYLANNDHILQLYEIIDSCHSSPKKIILITEYLDGGDLFNEIAKEELLTEIEVTRIIKQILEGISFIHSKGVIHRDLKPENIMYQSKEIQNIKIIDFGLAVHYNKNNPPKSMVGTTIFAAPEVLRYENQSYQTDIWSIGVIAYDLLAGITPFEIPKSGDLDRELTDNEIINNIQSCQYDFEDEGFTGVSDGAKNFISKILLLDPKKRLTSEQCLQDPWLSISLQKKKIIIRKMSVMRMKNYISTNKLGIKNTPV